MSRTFIIAAGALSVAFAGIAAYAWLSQSVEQAASKPLQTPAQRAFADRLALDSRYKTEGAKENYIAFVEKHKASPDPGVQDQVGDARLKLAYLTAKHESFGHAREQFLQTAAEYKGTGSTSPDFGGVKDQALYQAAVCLDAEGKKKEARAEFIRFIQQNPESPLITAAHRRIVRIDGKHLPDVDGLVKKALDQQEKTRKYESSVCGPKAAAHLLELLGKGTFDYKQLAKECGTTDEGTSMHALRHCLKNHGASFYGFELSRRDFSNIPLPALLLHGDHYLVVTEVNALHYQAYDSRYKATVKHPLPPLDDPQFKAIVLSSAPPRIN